MPAIHIPERRFRQPVDIVGVHPDWEGRVVSLIHFGSGAPRDLVDWRANYAIGGAAQIEPARPGISGLRTGAGGTTNGYIEASGAMADWTGQPTMVFFLPEIGVTHGAYGGMLYAIPAATNYTQFFPGSADTLYVLGGPTVPLGENLAGTRNRSLIVRAVTGAESIFVDRRKVTGTTGSLGPGAKTVRIGAWSSGSYQFNGVYGSVAIIKGAITDDEAYQLVDNPWGLYEAERSVIYSLPAGGIVTLNSLSVSNITSSGARFTVGLTR